MTFGSAVPTGDSIQTTLLVDGVSSGLSCTIAAGSNSVRHHRHPGSDGGPAVEIETVNTGGSTAFMATATTALSESIPAAVTDFQPAHQRRDGDGGD